MLDEVARTQHDKITNQISHGRHAAAVNQKGPTAAETAKAIERLHCERDAYNKAQEVAGLEAEERASLKLQDSFDAGFRWAHTASYADLRTVAEGGESWLMARYTSHRFAAKPPFYGDHDPKEFQAGAKAFFEQLPKV
jgi:hypothetical protein